MAKIFQNDGNIDSLTARKNILIIRAVDYAQAQIFDPDNVIQGRVECYCVNHFPTSTMFSYFLYFWSGIESVITVALSNEANVTGDMIWNLLRSLKIYFFFECPIAKRLIMASFGSGVVNPTSGEMPFVPKNPIVKCSLRR